MQAITTKVVPATNTKPTRIKAECARGSMMVSADSGLNDSKTHRECVKALIMQFCKEDLAQYGTPISGNPWNAPFVTGQMKNSDYCHIFTK